MRNANRRLIDGYLSRLCEPQERIHEAGLENQAEEQQK